MTPQERDLVTALLQRVNAAAGQPKDAEADELIRRAAAGQPDMPYLLAQTVLIQDMALAEAHNRITELESRAVPAPPAAAPPSFLAGARGSVPAAGSWPPTAAPPTAAPAPTAAPVWTQSNPGAPAPAAPTALAPLAGPGMSSGFLRSAATTAMGVAGGALLFRGIESLFFPHYGNFLGGMPMQPGIGETVINNYNGDGQPDAAQADWQQPSDDPGVTQADDSQDYDTGGSDDSGGGGGTDV